MLLEKDKSCLLLIDVQEKLTPYVIEPERLVHGCEWLLKLANKLGVPLLVSEQYPRGLGQTVDELSPTLTEVKRVEKVHFSCGSDEGFMAHLKTLNRKQIVLMGIETHVCVMQTAMELKEKGFEVFVVVDAVSCRHEIDHRYGLKRMKAAGVQLITREMVFFEWLRQAGTPEFKALSQEFMK
ncbi:hydrolase [Legionella impletisoli]|uniref:Isochorismatase n=1 Tax=Legionella impletisoli TaxID=343510 RepID=A0A917JPR1_9GAMM|nr:hydrolase [Legionella impletisoli]GGI77520.1 isochorismatase [Legionella impletisoli]